MCQTRRRTQAGLTPGKDDNEVWRKPGRKEIKWFYWRIVLSALSAEIRVHDDLERAKEAEQRARSLMAREGITQRDLKLAEARLHRALVRQAEKLGPPTRGNRNCPGGQSVRLSPAR